jgi:Matrixin
MHRLSASARIPAVACAVAIALLLIATSAASAASAGQRFPVGGTVMQAAWGVAVKHWGAVPCGGAVRMSWRAMGPEFNAVSEWLATDPRQPATYSSCNIVFNDAIAYSRARLCSVMVHEVGHLLGREHTRRHGDVMNEFYEGPIPVCRSTAGTTARASSTRRTNLRSASRARRLASCRRTRARTGRVSASCARLLRAARRTSRG